MESPATAGNTRATRLLLVAVIAVAAAFVVQYCRAAGPYWKITPDSTTYVLGAQSLAQGQGYRESGAPASLFPPGTSALLAVGWIAGRGSYRVLNAEVILFALAALLVCFLFFRDSLGTAGSAVAVLLCLGSAEFFDRSTFLLSEVFFVFFSLLALWLYQRNEHVGAVLAALAACMTRSVGVSLAAALLLDYLRQPKKRWTQAAAYTLPLLFIASWELRNRLIGWSYTKLMTQNEPWNPASGHIAPVAMLSRLFANLAYGRAFEDLLTNDLTANIGWAVLPGLVLAALIGAGCRRLLRAGQAAAPTYSLLFAIVVAMYWPEVVIRLMVPILPLLFGYLVAGVQEVAERWKPAPVYVPAFLCLGLYLASGLQAVEKILAEDGISPVPYQTVKYSGHDDMQRLAMWWRANAGANDTYACQHPDIIGIITGRSGVNYSAGRAGEIENRMRQKHARHLLLNLNSSADARAAAAVQSSANFRLIRHEGQAQLYELLDGSSSR